MLGTTTKKKTARKPRRRITKTDMALGFIQFSKKITVYVLAYWGIYRLAQLVVVVIRPEIADALVKFSSGVDTVAIAFGTGYTINSVSEKAMNMHKDVQKYMYLGTKDESDPPEGGDSLG